MGWEGSSASPGVAILGYLGLIANPLAFPWNMRARRSQEEEPGGAWTLLLNRKPGKPGGARRSQEEPGGARRSQEEPGGARRKHCHSY